MSDVITGRRRITRSYHAGDRATLVGQKESHPQSYLAWWRVRINIAPRHDARKNNVSPVVDGGVYQHPLQVFAPGYRVPGPATRLSVCVLWEKRKMAALSARELKSKGSKEKGIAMSPPSFTPRRPNSVGPKTPPPGAGWPERIICVSCLPRPTNTPSPPVVTSAVKPTSPRLLMALGSKSKVKLSPPGQDYREKLSS